MKTFPQPLVMYEPGRDHDLLVAQWWMRMERDGDLGDLFIPGWHNLASLFRVISPPNTLVFKADTSGIWFAMWGEGLMSGMHVGAWLAEDRRKSRAGLDAFLDAWELYLTHAPVLLGVTKQERLLGAHARIGYTVMKEPVPGLFGGKDAWVMFLTREEFLKHLPRFRPQRMSSAMKGVV